MTDDIEANRKMLTEILDGFANAGLVKQYVVDDGKSLTEGRCSITWTEDGAKMIAGYARAYWSVGEHTQGKVEVLHLFLEYEACRLAKQQMRFG